MAVEPTHKNTQGCLLDFFEAEGAAALVARALTPKFPRILMIRVYTFRQARMIKDGGVHYHVGYLHFHRSIGLRRRTTFNWDIHVIGDGISLVNTTTNNEDDDSTADGTPSRDTLSCGMLTVPQRRSDVTTHWVRILTMANTYVQDKTTGMDALD